MDSSQTLPCKIEDLVTPCLLLDIDVAKKNCQTMTDRCKDMGVTLRSHMKTHKCLELGAIATNDTKRCIVVSTLKEAEYFADGGFDDILLGIIFTADKIPRMRRLAERLDQFHLMLDSTYCIDLLIANPLSGKKWSVFLKVDSGGNRSGVLWDSKEAIDLASRLANSDNITFQGLYSHEGNSYRSTTKKQLLEFGEESSTRMLSLAKRMRDNGVEVKSVGTGATPTCTEPSPTMSELTEVHPGNYVFYDAMQYFIGVCKLDDIAVKVATRIKGHYPHRNQMLIDAGFLGLSDQGIGKLPNETYCLVQGHPNLRVTKMSQEVGRVDPIEGKLNYEDFPIGSLLYLLPYHSCSTANMYDCYYVRRGDDIIAVWPMCRGW